MTFFIQVSIKMVIDATEIYALPILYLSQGINKCKLVSGPAKVMEKIPQKNTSRYKNLFTRPASRIYLDNFI